MAQKGRVAAALPRRRSNVSVPGYRRVGALSLLSSVRRLTPVPVQAAEGKECPAPFISMKADVGTRRWVFSRGNVVVDQLVALVSVNGSPV